MRRIVALTILIVVLSTLLNLAVALGFWWFGERPPPFDPSTFDPEIVVDPRPLGLVVWRNRRGPDWPQEPQEASRHSFFGITFRSMVWVHIEWSGSPDDVDSRITKQDNYSIDTVELGWPLRCIAGEHWGEYHGQPGPYQNTSGMLVAFGAQWPTRVIWPGMIVNELFYVLLFATTFAGWRYGRRWIRRRRGRCPQCDYDLRGNSGGGCPECGWKRPEISV